MSSFSLQPQKKIETTCKNGIGILEFLPAKNYFVTGATGFLGKAYVNIENVGEILNPKSSPLLHPPVDVDAEVKLALDSNLALRGSEEIVQKMKELGLERARCYGWKNVYEFTKAMGEILIDKNREEIPVAIVRPSVIESTFKEPYPGWLQGIRMADPLILAYGKGYLPAFINPEAVIDIIPVDMVVNAIISTMAKHGITRKPELNVYHIASSRVNPVKLKFLFDMAFEHFKSSPIKDMKGKEVEIKRVQFLSSLEEIFLHISKQSIPKDANVSLGHERKLSKEIEHIIDMIKTYEPYLYSRWFESSDTYKLWEAMSLEEQLSFGFDVKRLDWQDYFSNVHMPGLRNYVIKSQLRPKK